MRDDKKKRYVRPEDEPKEKKGPPPPGCATCRGGPHGGGAITIALVEWGPPPLCARSTTEYACRCACARGTALFGSLPLADSFANKLVADKPGAQVLWDPTPRELRGIQPMTLEEGKGEERRLSAILAANPGWKVGEKVLRHDLR